MLNPTIQPGQDICNVGLAWSVNNLKVRKPIGEGLIFPHGQKALTSVHCLLLVRFCLEALKRTHNRVYISCWKITKA